MQARKFVGILRNLDDKSLNSSEPKPNEDRSFGDDLIKQYATNKAALDKRGKKSAGFFHFKNTAQGREFTIQHFAGGVTYLTIGFIQKNKDFTPPHLVKIMKESSNDFIANVLYATPDSSSTVRSSPRPSSKKKGPRTIASRFKKQLNSLEKTLDDTNPFFIRCIKPNEVKLSVAKAAEMGKHISETFNAKMVAQQLLFGGVMETVGPSLHEYFRCEPGISANSTPAGQNTATRLSLSLKI